MNQFVHCRLGHFFMEEADGEGGDLGGGADDSAEEQEEEAEEEEQEEGEQQSEEDGEVVVTIGDEKPPEEQDDSAAPAWVKDLRKANREDKKRIRELEELVRKQEVPKDVPALGKKPTMDDADIDYDADKFEAALTAWHDRKREIDQAATKAQQQKQKQEEEWQATLKAYGDAKSKLKVKDFDDAEAVIMELFDQTQQGLILDSMDDPALVIYALGRNRKHAEKLAAIKKPTKFLREVSRLEDTKLKVQKRQSAPPPEKTISGTGKVSGSVDSNLERLRAEAEKSGDYSKVTAYRKKLKEKSRATS